MRTTLSFSDVSERRWMLMLGLVFVAVLARMATLGSESLHYDEAYAVYIAETKSLPAILMGYPELSPHPPLYFLLLKFWTSVFGTVEWSVRLPSALFGVASVLLLYSVGRTLFDHRAAMVSATLLTFSGFHVFHSQNARMYSLLSALTLASVYFYLRCTDDPSRLELGSYALSTVLLLYTHVFGAFVLLAQVVYNGTGRTLFTDARRIERSKWLQLLGIVALAYAPLFALQVQQVVFIREAGVLIGWVEQPSLGTVAIAFLSYIGYQSSTPILLLRSLPFVVIGGSVLLLWANSIVSHPISRPIEKMFRSPETNDGIYLLLIWIGTIHAIPWLLSYFVTPIYFTRVTIPASLAVFLLIGLGVSRLQRVHLQYGVTTILIVSLLIPLGGYYTEHQRDEWRESVDYVESHASANATVVLVSDSTDSADLRIPFRYYSDRTDLELRAVGTKDRELDSRVRSLTDDGGQVWVVFGRSHSLGAGNVRTIRDILGGHCDAGRHEEFVRITIRSYNCTPPG